MLNEDRVKLMVKLASYEEREGKKDLKISSYYKKDYVSFNRWSTMIWTTVGYAMLVGIFGVAYMDAILEELTFMKLIILAGGLVAVWLVVLIVYWIAAGHFFEKKHNDARRNIKGYSHNLLVLNKLYEKENM